MDDLGGRGGAVAKIGCGVDETSTVISLRYHSELVGRIDVQLRPFLPKRAEGSVVAYFDLRTTGFVGHPTGMRSGD